AEKKNKKKIPRFLLLEGAAIARRNGIPDFWFERTARITRREIVVYRLVENHSVGKYFFAPFVVDTISFLDVLSDLQQKYLSCRPLMWKNRESPHNGRIAN